MHAGVLVDCVEQVESSFARGSGWGKSKSAMPPIIIVQKARLGSRALGKRRVGRVAYFTNALTKSCTGIDSSFARSAKSDMSCVALSLP